MLLLAFVNSFHHLIDSLIPEKLGEALIRHWPLEFGLILFDSELLVRRSNKAVAGYGERVRWKNCRKANDVSQEAIFSSSKGEGAVC